MTRLGRSCAAVVLLVVVVAMAACTNSVAGRAIRASGQPRAHISARDLLLQDGDNTPLGPASSTRVGETYFTSARPPECTAAVLFKGSPLRPPGSADFAESAYRVQATAMYAESVDVYSSPLNPHDVVQNGFRAVSQCHGDAFAGYPAGEFGPITLKSFGTPAEGVLVWSMGRSDWNCDYGLAVVPRAALVISACDQNSGFPMAEWAVTRRAQLDDRV
ncbi:hypothetical protein [Mycobacterium marinum]|uniref:hypothetical protein n=1 Tax=Mycobacterium marinum TaxID=1781 RepID=UPI0021C2BFBB|nr:hypothetical protein [Mycobacterium marinum]